MGMLDRAGYSLNDLFRFSTKDQKWEQLALPMVCISWSVGAIGCESRLYSSMKTRLSVGMMVSVGSDFYVFGGETLSGEEGLSMIDIVLVHVR